MDNNNSLSPKSHRPINKGLRIVDYDELNYVPAAWFFCQLGDRGVPPIDHAYWRGVLAVRLLVANSLLDGGKTKSLK